MEALDFDIFAGGHGAPGTKADVTANRQFFEELVTAVSAGMAQGKTLAELQQTILFEKYKDWSGYAARRAPTIDFGLPQPSALQVKVGFVGILVPQQEAC